MPLRKILLLLVCLCLTGCVAAVMAGAATTGMVVYDKRSVTSIEKDARIFYVIHKQIVTDPQFRGSRIEVISFNQTVLLVGQTPVASLRVLAEKIAKATPNVKRVYNELSIDSPLPFKKVSEDALITGNVRTLMLGREKLESGSIRIVTENGIVYLLGIVTPEQAANAADVASQTRGVRKVVKAFQYVTIT